MAQERPLTPEKQLLNLIENPQAKNASGVGPQAIKYQSLSLFSPAAWVGRIAFFRDKLIKVSRGQEAIQLEIPLINKFLGGLILALIVYLISNSYFSMANLKKILNNLQTQVIAQKGQQRISDTASVLSHGVDYYIEKVGQRDIFSMQVAKKAGQEVPEVTDEEITELTQTLKLVGISLSSNPDVIIEDTKSSRTYFLKKGQEINGARIKEVLPDKVIFVYGDQEFELR